MKFIAPLMLALSLTIAVPAQAGIGSRAAGELTEFVMKKFGKSVASEGAEALTRKIASAAARHGDDVLKAVHKVGPKAITLADGAGANAPSVIRLLTHYGDDAARVLGRPQGLALVTRYGDDAAKVIIKHKGVAAPLIENMGEPAVKALGTLGPQGGRRLAMMAGDDLVAIGRTPELLDVVAQYGDRAMDFIWKHKGVLAGSAALATFLRDPEPFLSGAADLTRTVAEEVVQPMAQAAATAVQPMVQAAGVAMQPAVAAAAHGARQLAIWVGGGLLVVLLSVALIARMISKSGFLGKLIFKTGIGVAAEAIKGK